MAVDPGASCFVKLRRRRSGTKPLCGPRLPAADVVTQLIMVHQHEWIHHRVRACEFWRAEVL
jgi:hypothetical protein